MVIINVLQIQVHTPKICITTLKYEQERWHFNL